jgi:hypothetical protein
MPAEITESRRAPVRSPYAFVKSDWHDIREDFEKNRARDGEFFICNGRVNELWNSMFTNIRNETVRQRYPDDLPGTIIEVNKTDAGKLNIQNGDVVAIKCDDIHLGGSGEFRAVVSIQSDSAPSGIVFVIFSYPATSEHMNEFPFRNFNHEGYVNNITTGYVDPMNPIAAVKFARGTITKLDIRYSAGKYLGPSYAVRNRAFVSTVVGNEDERLRWKMRELVVQKGVPRVRLHAEVDKAIADLILDPDLFLEALKQDRTFREGFKAVLDGGLMEWKDAQGNVLDAWTQKELNLAFTYIAQVESSQPKTAS